MYVLAGLFFLFKGIIPSGDGLNKSDWLQFYGSFITLIGPLFLGWLALKQNESLLDINKKLLALEKRKYSLNFLSYGFQEYSDNLNILVKNASLVAAFELQANALYDGKKELSTRIQKADGTELRGRPVLRDECFIIRIDVESDLAPSSIEVVGTAKYEDSGAFNFQYYIDDISDRNENCKYELRYI